MAQPTGASGDDNIIIGINYLTYPFCLIGPIVILLMKKDEPNIKFHALQAIFVGLALFLLSLVLGFGIGILSAILPIFGIFGLLLYPVYGLIWLALTVMGFMGNVPRIPVIADLVDRVG